MSLPSPLTASDEYVRGRDAGIEIVRLTAGLHRQVWVSGTCLFVDTHVANGGRKAIKRLELKLERDILCYKHVCSDSPDPHVQDWIAHRCHDLGRCIDAREICQPGAHLRHQRPLNHQQNGVQAGRPGLEWRRPSHC